MDEFAESKEREKLGEGTGVRDLPDEAAHLDLSLLAIGIARPIDPAEVSLLRLDLLRLCNEFLKVEGELSPTVEIRQGGETPEEVSDQDVEVEVVDQGLVESQTHQRQEVESDLVRQTVIVIVNVVVSVSVGTDGVVNVIVIVKAIAGGADEEAVGENLGVSAVDGPPGFDLAGSRLTAGLCQAKCAAIAPDAQSAQFLEGVDEVREVIDCLADQDKAEGELRAGFVHRGLVVWGFNDERVRGVRVFAKDCGVGRRGCFKDVGVGTGRFQDAGRTLAAANRTGDFPKDVAEAAAKNRAFVGRETQPIPGFKRERKAGYPERIELRRIHGLLPTGIAEILPRQRLRPNR